MKKERHKVLMAAAVLAGFLMSTIFLPAQPADLAKEYGSAIAGIYGLMCKQRIALYGACATYYLKFDRWPSSEAELEEYFKGADNKDAHKNAVILDILSEINIDFIQLEDGSVLIEGGYREKNEKAFEKARLGKCRIGVVGHRIKEGFSFLPSEKAINNSNYFNLPIKLDMTKSGKP